MALQGSSEFSSSYRSLGIHAMASIRKHVQNINVHQFELMERFHGAHIGQTKCIVLYCEFDLMRLLDNDHRTVNPP